MPRDKMKAKKSEETRKLRTVIRGLDADIADLQREKRELEAGSAKVVESLNASSAHLKRMVELCDKQRAEIAELKGVMKTLVKYV